MDEIIRKRLKRVPEFRDYMNKCDDDSHVHELQIYQKELSSLDTHGLIQMSRQLRDDRLSLIIQELIKRTDPADISTLEKTISSLIPQYLDGCHYQREVWFHTYRLLFSLMTRTGNLLLQKTIAVFLGTRLRYRLSGDLAAMMEEQMGFMKEFLFDILESRDMSAFVSEHLNAAERLVLIKMEPMNQPGLRYREWLHVQKDIIKLLLDPKLVVTWDGMVRLFHKCINDDTRMKFAEVLRIRMMDEGIESIQKHFFNSVPRQILSRFFIDMYRTAHDELKNIVILWISRSQIQSALNFLMDLYESGNDRSEEIIHGIRTNADRLLQRIIHLYKSSPAAGAPLISGISINLSAHKKRITEKHGKSGLDEKGLEFLITMVHDICYSDERAAGSEYITYCAMLKTESMLNIYTVGKCFRIVSLLNNIASASKKDRLMDVLLINDTIIENDIILNSLLLADENDISLFKENLERGSASEMAFDLMINRTVPGYDINNPEDMERIYCYVKGKIAREKYISMCIEARGHSIPEMPVGFTLFIINGSRPKDAAPTNQNFSWNSKKKRYDDIFRNILETNHVISKRSRGQIIYHLECIFGKKISEMDIRDEIDTAGFDIMEKVYTGISRILIKEFSIHKKLSTQDIIYMISRDYLFNRLHVKNFRDRENKDSMSKRILPEVLNIENTLYSEYFTEIQKKHIKMLYRLEKNNIFTEHASSISDLRHMYRFRMEQLKGGINLSSKALIAEMNVINSLLKDIFIFDRFLSQTAIQTGHIIKNNNEIQIYPANDPFLIFRSFTGNDCNKGNISQIKEKNSIFFRIYNRSKWIGYAGCLVLKGKNVPDALLIDVINVSKMPMDSALFLEEFFYNLSVQCREMNIKYILSSPDIGKFSNKDYIRKAGMAYYTGNFIKNSWKSPKANFQSVGEVYNVLVEV